MAFTKEQARELIRSAKQAGRLPHALMITGSPDSGTLDLVRQLSCEFNGFEVEDLDSLRHPNCLIIKPQAKSRMILIDEIRQVEPFLQMKIEQGQLKIVIILEADRLNEASSNAFLKTLEEPPPQSLIFLITQHPEQLLTTILSRCIRLDLREPDGSVQLSPAQLAFLPACTRVLRGLGKDLNALCLRAALVSILAQRRAEITQRITQDVKDESKILAQQTGVQNWESQQKDATAGMIETEYLGERDEMIDLLVLCLGQAALLAAGSSHVVPLCKEIPAVAQHWGAPELLRRMKAIEELRNDLKYNVNEPLALDYRFLQAFGEA